jgi:dGTPase
MVTDLLAETGARIQRVNPRTIADIRAQAGVMVAFPETTRALNRELKQFLYERLYFHPRVIRMMKKAEKVVQDLFQTYVAEPRMLPSGARSWLESLPLERVVCNYIAGMTDRFALDEHARLFDPHERV